MLEVATSAAVAGYGGIVLKGKMRLFFLLTIIFFFLSRIIHFEQELLHEWARHIPFYVGQISCYLFLIRIISLSKHTKKAQPSSPATPPGISTPSSYIGLIAGSSPFSYWFEHATEQGFQHILTLPLMLLVIGGIQAHFPFITSSGWKKVINGFLLAMLPLTLIHMGEFIIESQQWLPWESIIEPIETVLYVSAMITFIIAIRNLHTFNADE